MLPSVLPKLATDSAARMFPGVWKPLFLRVSSRDGIPFPGRSSLLTSFVSFFVYFFLPVFEDNYLLFWVPDVLCQHSEVILWNLLSVEMFFWWTCEGESGLPVLFLHHLRTAPIFSFMIFYNVFFVYCLKNMYVIQDCKEMPLCFDRDF